MKSNTKRSVILSIILFLLYFSPYLIKGKKVYIPIHDNLNQLNMQGIFDGKFSAEFFPQNVETEFTLPGTESIFHLAHIKLDKLFFSFDFFYGYIFNEFFYRLIGFLGLFFLLKNYIFRRKISPLYPLKKGEIDMQFQRKKQPKNPPPFLGGERGGSFDYFLILLSFSFISLPFWPQGNLSIAGIPLLIFAFLNLRNHTKLIISYSLIILYAFYSNFFFAGIYFIPIFILLIFLRKINLQMTWGVILLLLCFAFSHLPVVLNLLYYGIPVARIFQDPIPISFISALKMSVWNFLFSSALSVSYHIYLIFPISAIISIYLYIKKKPIKYIILIWVIIVLNSVIYGFYFYKPFITFYNSLKIGFNFSRIYVLNSVLWYLLFALCLAGIFQISKQKSLIKIFSAILIIQICLNSYAFITEAFTQKPTFEKFVSEAQFFEISKKINANKSDFRIGCIGFFPSVANYNGFETIGSFSSYYPVDFKMQIRKIIQNEIKQNSELNDYFTKRGSALFLFDDEIGKHYRDQEYIEDNVEEIQCDLDIYELKELGVKYLFSTVRISNQKDINLDEIIVSDNEEYYYQLYVYEILEMKE